ncbi:hypothetical protein QVD17_05761 [Tagetes erecta]|uniref:Uncharacterized protein n=1 Tax=Tagetes erecta TaxID=13708 RepID=A0AAD8PBS3_TARER|nr:hypothetical protein QVD17_05761 [Tagetes erecta]
MSGIYSSGFGSTRGYSGLPVSHIKLTRWILKEKDEEKHPTVEMHLEIVLVSAYSTSHRKPTNTRIFFFFFFPMKI